MATFAVAPDGSVRLANSAAGAMLNRGDILFVDADRRLQFRCGKSQRNLLLALAQHNVGSEQQRSSFLVEAHKMAASYLVRVACLPADDPAQPAGLVTVVSMNDVPQLDAALLQSLYRLSPAEAKVAVCLGLGQDVTTCAEQLGVRPATVRAQLKAVFRKMSINRQQELVRIATLLGLYSGH